MRPSLPLALASVTLLAALGCVPEPGPYRFDIVGTVRAAADSTPVAGALVRLTAPGSVVEPNELLGEATTDAQGNYQLSGPLPRGYVLQPGDPAQGVDCSIVALHATKAGFGVGPDEDGASVLCTKARQRIDVLMPAPPE